MSSFATLKNLDRRGDGCRAVITVGVLFVAAIFLLFPGQKDVVTSHEARVVQTARQMAASGNPWSATPLEVPAVGLQQTTGGLRLLPVAGGTPLWVNPWLVPVMNGSIRLQKPPLPYWCAAILFRAGGVEYSEGLSRLFPALFGFLSCLIVADVAGLLFDKRSAAFAAMVWVSSYFVFDEFRKAMADPYLAFFSLVSIWAWIRAVDSRRSTAGWIVACYASFALASLAKFPVNLLHVGCALATFHVCYRRRLPGDWKSHAIGVALFLLIALPWPIYVMTHVPHAVELWRYESVGEFSDNTEKARGAWFYFANLFQLVLPWTPVWVTGVIYVIQRRDRRSFFPLAWFAVELVIFTFSNVKKNAYLLPLMPAMVLIVVQGLHFIILSDRLARFRKVGRSMIAMQIGIGVAFAIVVPGVMVADAPNRPDAHAIMLTIVIAIGLVALSIIPIAIIRQNGPIQWITAQSIAYAVLIFAFYHLEEYPHENQRSARQIAARLTPLLQNGEAAMEASIPEDASLYLPLNVRYADDRSQRILRVIDDPRGDITTDTGVSIDKPGTQIRPMDMTGVNGSQRWKVFELIRSQ